MTQTIAITTGPWVVSAVRRLLLPVPKQVARLMIGNHYGLRTVNAELAHKANYATVQNKGGSELVCQVMVSESDLCYFQ